MASGRRCSSPGWPSGTAPRRLRSVSAVVEHFDAKVDSSSDERAQVLAALRELNQNLVSQSNRLVAQFEDLRERVQVIEDVIRSNAPRARLNRYARTLAVMARSAGRSARS